MSTSERLERLETSHVRLMTEHEVLFREYEVYIGQHKEWLREYDARCERDREERREMGKELDRRILELVSGIGQFLRQAKR
jgi:hypothetical protein